MSVSITMGKSGCWFSSTMESLLLKKRGSCIRLMAIRIPIRQHTFPSLRMPHLGRFRCRKVEVNCNNVGAGILNILDGSSCAICLSTRSSNEVPKKIERFRCHSGADTKITWAIHHMAVPLNAYES